MNVREMTIGDWVLVGKTCSIERKKCKNEK